MNYKHLFGPVNSRRLGISLGVDLVPPKTCSLNCIYCEAGKTTLLTDSRTEYVKFTDIVTELDDYLSSDPHLDFITFSGAGEPTLFSRLGELILHIKNKFPEYKICLLTNSTMFSDPKVISEVLPVDIILPSLDAVSEDIFQKINRPCSSISAKNIVDGLIELRKKFSNQIWLEIFIVPGINDSDREISLFKQAILLIKPDQVQLNSLDRPGTEDWVLPENRNRLNEIAMKLQPTADEMDKMHFKTIVTIIAKTRENHQKELHSGDLRDKILTLLARRPSTLNDLVGLLSFDEQEINLILNELTEKAQIETQTLPRGIFYRIRKPGIS
jgi:wyosine [tRNA(Phe)-imidazoG37] synthetase (radical SAM superfamily)